MPGLFLLLYTLFFVATGVNQLSLGTMQGKLIRASLRGRLFTSASVIGATGAVTAAWLLLGGWLAPGSERFDLIFGFAGGCFALSIVAILLVREPPDDFQHPPVSPLGHAKAAWDVLHTDANFRRLAQVATLFGTSIMLFPHYQAFAVERLGFDLQNMTLWVIVQNLGTAAISVLGGPLADRRGNRVVLWILMASLTVMPVLAIVLGHTGPFGKRCFPLVFLLVGMTPMTLKTLQNYTLEICAPVAHARYLSTLSLCVASPILLSPLVGLLVDLTSFELVFSIVSLLLLTGLLRSLHLKEPRHHLPSPAETAGLTGEE